MPIPKQRLDLLLVERGLAESRAQAQALTMGGNVRGAGQPAPQPGRATVTSRTVEVKHTTPYVVRGGRELELSSLEVT